MSDKLYWQWHEEEAKSECLDLRVRVRELEIALNKAMSLMGQNFSSSDKTKHHAYCKALLQDEKG